MHARGGSQWQSRRKASLGPLRRAHPASGATWNVQVVRGKMTSRCLWHACRALVLGMVLMFVGGGMATVGYYANNFPSLSDLRSNSSTSTIRVKNEHRGLHLNNLSYVGPIIMGVGGFIVVASCVMTFEARDSAAKVVPARFKLSSQSNRNPSRQNTSRRSTVGNGTGPGLITAAQTARWEQHLGVFRTSPATEQVPDRKALTAALVHFSKALGTPKSSPQQRRPSEGASRRVSRSGSVPNLYGDKLSVPSLASGSPANNIRSELLGGGSGHRQHHHHQHHQQHQHHRGTRVSSMVQRSTRGEVAGSGGLLHPGMLQFHRHALSVDEPDPFVRTLHQAGSHGSVQYGCSGGEIVPVHKLREQRTKRSDTARRHVLSRQTKIEKDEQALGGSPKQTTHQHQQQQPAAAATISRRASTVSNASVGSKQLNRSSRRASTISKTPSVDSRGAPSTLEINSPERSVGLTPRKGGASGGGGVGGSALISTPSVDRECRSQLSICSEPAQISQRNLSCQSSLEPCVPEEDSPDHDETEPLSVVNQPLRPDSLVLAAGDNTTDHPPAQPQNRFLYRSNSTKSFRKPKPKIAAKKRSNEYDQIYVIGAGTSVTGNNRFPNFYHHRDDDHYDSIEVIHERRNKNFSKFSDNPPDTTAPDTETAPVPVTPGEPAIGTDATTAESPSVITDSSGEYRKVGSNTISVVADISPVPVSPLEQQQQPDTETASCVPPDPGGKEPEVAHDEGNESKTTGQQQVQNVPAERCEAVKQE
ncbi:uncharacterized protein LOC118464809 isoform X2 [Anopheles albimanus]|uniref:uncharacterized protein LOC118464809 isoform X2 n=1 Tax=Anopheles albimanus TaxID=7167 RepID=UPI0016419460|nr:uncharacterized protein LOC118464809 isoform X2 [Anopheles albimanus]